MRTLQTLGVVEDLRDERNKRFGTIYSLPLHSSTLRQPVTLQDFFPRDGNTLSELKEPLLSERFKLAHALSSGVHALHSAGWLHKELSSRNVVFLYRTSGSDDPEPQIQISEPYIVGFGYARPDTEEAVSLAGSSGGGLDLYRHPLLRGMGQGTEEEGQSIPRFQRKFDVYSLGLILLEIGLWDRVATFERSTDRADPQALADRLVRVCKEHLGHRLGAVYRDVVVRCIRGLHKEDNDDKGDGDRKEEDLMGFYWGVVRDLAKCHCK